MAIVAAGLLFILQYEAVALSVLVSSLSLDNACEVVIGSTVQLFLSVTSVVMIKLL